MSKILLVNYGLSLGGSEKLLYELACFAMEKNIRPTVLIVDNDKTEYYDVLLKQMQVPVVRTKLRDIKSIKNPKKLIKAVYWRLKLLYSATEFDSIHFINLQMGDALKDIVPHPNRFFWHVVNTIQYADRLLNVSKDLFQNPSDTVVFINDYQIKEIEQQYGATACKKLFFKLFLN